MIDVQPVDRVEIKRHQFPVRYKADMADDPETPDAAADRLAAALERIAHLAASRPASAYAAPEPVLSAAEIAERLDSLIGRLKAALGKPD